CHYAHGLHELRQVVKRHPKFRTEKCKNFELTGKCPFGPRCSYVHSKPDLDSMIEQLTRYVKHKRAPRPDSDDEQDENGTRRLRIKYTTPSSESTPTMDGGLTELESRDAYTNGAHSRISSFNNDENKENIEDIAAINSTPATKPRSAPPIITSQATGNVSQSESLLEILLSSIDNQHHVQLTCNSTSQSMTKRQYELCRRHSDIFDLLFGYHFKILFSDCAEKFSDLRWNCASVSNFIRRSSPFTHTKESAFIRALINAYITYNVIVACQSGYYKSCTCKYSTDVLYTSSAATINLETPILLESKSTCEYNIGFGLAFTSLLLDTEDNKHLNRAFKVLNGNYSNDLKEMALISWTRSAVNLHNNYAGRKIAQDYLQNRSTGKLNIDFQDILDLLKHIYGHGTKRVRCENLGTSNEPDLTLSTRFLDDSGQSIVVRQYRPDFSISDLLYLNRSPDFCSPLKNINFKGIKGRPCRPDKRDLAGGPVSGTCSDLCCNRGHETSLRLDLVRCNCRFKFCCRLVCEQCLKQSLAHRCL
ncbi:Protein Wnt-1, partial [Fragariocoptes setiger]